MKTEENKRLSIYLFTGVPGSGKSSLAKAFSENRNLKLISKDLIQLSFFNKYGFSSNEDKKKLVRKADEMVKDLIITSNEDLVIDKFVRDSEFVELLRNKGNLYIINLTADIDVLVSRYNKRRLDPARIPLETVNVFPYVEGVSQLFPPIDSIRMKEILDKYSGFIKNYSNVITVDNSSLSLDEEMNILNEKEI